jgi:Flp pilus assembly protein TadG
MISTTISSSLARTFRRFAGDRQGISAVEFAIVLPFAMSLYVGGVELADGLSIQYKTTLAARTVADLAAQYDTISNTTMSSILGAASTVLAPYTTSNIVVIVSEVTTDDDGEGTITWSAALNGTAHAPGQEVTLPTAMQTPKTAFIWGEVTYPYTPNIGNVLTSIINVYENTYFYPRKSSCVTYISAC